MSIVCEYETTESRNKELMANVKVIYKYLTSKKVNLKVKARFMHGDLKYQWQGVLCVNVKEILVCL